MVSESKPTAQPKQPKRSKQNKQQQLKPYKSFFQNIAARVKEDRMVFQLASGTSVEGVIADEESGVVMIVDAIIRDKNSTTKLKWVRMERNQIRHFNPIPTEIEIIKPVT